MGINVVNDTLISFVPSYVSLLRHGYQSGNAKLAKLFKQALENGTLDRRIFESTLNDNSDFALYEGTMYIRKERLIEEDSVREKKLKFVNKENGKGFLIFVDYFLVGRFADELSVKAFHSMYDVFIPNWQGPQ